MTVPLQHRLLATAVLLTALAASAATAQDAASARSERQAVAVEEASATPAQDPALSAEDIADVRRVNAYLNTLETMRGKFDQLSYGGGRSSGAFYLKMPGRMRFDYDPPAELAFVADGDWVAVDDRALEVVNRYPLDSTPLKFLVADEIDLLAEATVRAVERAPGQLRVTLEETEGPAQGRLTLIFSDPEMELRQWVVEDVQGQRTTVQLRDVEKGVRLSNRLFVIEDTELDTLD